MRRYISFKPNTKINKLTVLNKDVTKPNNHWICRCDCGNTKSIKATNLDKSKIKSCGCVHGFPHMYVNKPLYRSWYQMKDRCKNKKRSDYKYYAGKGITYSPEWERFPFFLKWALENGYKEGLTIDRIDNSKGYTPENCRWATRKEQSINQERVIKFNGEACSDASVRLGGSPDLVRSRIRNGWDVTKAFTEPVRDWHPFKKR